MNDGATNGATDGNFEGSRVGSKDVTDVVGSKVGWFADFVGCAFVGVEDGSFDCCCERDFLDSLLLGTSLSDTSSIVKSNLLWLLMPGASKYVSFLVIKGLCCR